ncbi:MAG: hypothetical protein IJM50_05150 [Lachnospiraceae bacterium]|nr:hypothetical protein [Lachnospiraceae bacterium]
MESIMKIGAETKLKDILDAYPWLLEEAVKTDERLKVINSPIAKLFIRRATVGDLSRKAGLKIEEVIEKIEEVILGHESA